MSQRRSPTRIVLVVAVVAVVLVATSHAQVALWVAAAGAVYAGVEGIIAWRSRR
ncbi:hypothetical protein RBS60_01565 [Sinomonas sp. ASV486]|uniref:hypothetical protein n=1 Tax=Sinomonas sp. ASV486 TaxID=3051170 RepID=UPI0027DC96E0|nr:hypothetical protein [Sinomonas sp. ASV486]MDQ4488881.1 hypothetical protein [Sinomonas sp. ASV486]